MYRLLPQDLAGLADCLQLPVLQIATPLPLPLSTLLCMVCIPLLQDALLLEYQQKHAAGELDPGMSPEQQKLALALLAAERAGTLSGGSGGMLALPAPGDNEDDEDGGGGKRRRLTNEADEEDEEGGGSKAGAKRSSNGGSDEEEDEEAGDEEVTEGSIVPVENPGQLALMNANAPGMMCEHIQHGAAMFAARMCYSCFHDYVKFTGGGAIGRVSAGQGFKGERDGEEHGLYAHCKLCACVGMCTNARITVILHTMLLPFQFMHRLVEAPALGHMSP